MRAWRAKARATLVTPVSTDSPDVALDRRVWQGELAAQEVFDDFDWLARNPAASLEIALQGLQTLLARPRADAATQAAALHARLAALPALLAHARRQLNDGRLVFPAFVEIALVGCAGADRLLAAFNAARARAPGRSGLRGLPPPGARPSRHVHARRR